MTFNLRSCPSSDVSVVINGAYKAGVYSQVYAPHPEVSLEPRGHWWIPSTTCITAGIITQKMEQSKHGEWTRAIEAWWSEY